MHSIKERNTVYVLKSDSNFGVQQVSNWATGILNSEKKFSFGILAICLAAPATDIYLSSIQSTTKFRF